MGYTHYWYRQADKDFDPKTWGKFIADSKKLADSLPSDVRIQFEWDTPEAPVFDDSQIRFNGVGNAGHETFEIPRVCPPATDYHEMKEDPKVFGFCKTARKPYDLLVTAVLALYKHYFGQAVKVHSDGDAPDWQAGIKFVAKVLGLRTSYTKVIKSER